MNQTCSPIKNVDQSMETEALTTNYPVPKVHCGVLSYDEKKAAEWERILNACPGFAGGYLDDIEYCVECDALWSHSKRHRLGRPSLGLGPDEEHCSYCGAAPEHQNMKIEGYTLAQLLRAAVRVERAYSSPEPEYFMTKLEMEKNRKFLKQLFDEMDNHLNECVAVAYQRQVGIRHAQELFERVIRLATVINGGNEEEAHEKYAFMSREIEDLYTVGDELQRQCEAIGKSKDSQSRH